MSGNLPGWLDMRISPHFCFTTPSRRTRSPRRRRCSTPAPRIRTSSRRSSPTVRPGCASAPTGTAARPGGGTGLTASEAFLALCDRAGVHVTVPEGIGNLCCGTPWKSKGLPTGYNKDLQDDKVILFTVFDTLETLLPAVTGSVGTMEFAVVQVDPHTRVV